jgi:tetratricopeptide (TPR) repeat protein
MNDDDIDRLERVRVDAARAGDDAVERRACRDLAKIERTRGHFESAWHAMLRAYAIDRAHGDRTAVAEDCVLLSGLAISLDRLDDAETYAAEVRGSACSAALRACALGHLGVIRQRQGDLIAAIDLFDGALVCALSDDRRDLAGTMYANLAAAHAAAGDPLAADVFAARACDLFTELRIVGELAKIRRLRAALALRARHAAAATGGGIHDGAKEGSHERD